MLRVQAVSWSFTEHSRFSRSFPGSKRHQSDLTVLDVSLNPIRLEGPGGEKNMLHSRTAARWQNSAALLDVHLLPLYIYIWTKSRKFIWVFFSAAVTAYGSEKQLLSHKDSSLSLRLHFNTGLTTMSSGWIGDSNVDQNCLEVSH